MESKNHPSQRRRGESRSNKKRLLSIVLFLIGGWLLSFAAFTTRDEDEEWQDDISEEEVDVEEIPRESIEEEHEVRDVPLRPVIYGALVLLAVAIVIHVGLWWLLEVWTEDELRFDPQVPPAVIGELESSVPVLEDPDFPGPDLQAAPLLEYDVYLAEQRELLESYGRLDGEEAFGRIPIERAMELLAEEGLPAEDGDVPNFGLDPAYELDSEGGQEFRPIFDEE